MKSFNDLVNETPLPEVAKNAGTTSRVKRKTTASNADVGDVEALAKAGNLKKLTVGILKQFLGDVGCSPVGKKDDLMEQVNKYFGL
jgi:hypothetical protein